jgi:hypothetical protein
MGNDGSKDVALLKEIHRKFGRTLTKNDRIRLHRLILQMEAPEPRRRPQAKPWAERTRSWLGTIAKIALALGLKKLFDHFSDA